MQGGEEWHVQEKESHGLEMQPSTTVSSANLMKELSCGYEVMCVKGVQQRSKYGPLWSSSVEGDSMQFSYICIAPFTVVSSCFLLTFAPRSKEKLFCGS